MHPSNCQIVIIVMSQHHSTDHDCYNSRHIEKLGHDIAQQTKNIDKNHLRDLALHQKSTMFENIRT